MTQLGGVGRVFQPQGQSDFVIKPRNEVMATAGKIWAQICADSGPEGGDVLASSLKLDEIKGFVSEDADRRIRVHCQSCQELGERLKALYGEENRINTEMAQVWEHFKVISAVLGSREFNARQQRLALKSFNLLLDIIGLPVEVTDGGLSDGPIGYPGDGTSGRLSGDSAADTTQPSLGLDLDPEDLGEGLAALVDGPNASAADKLLAQRLRKLNKASQLARLIALIGDLAGQADRLGTILKNRKRLDALLGEVKQKAEQAFLRLEEIDTEVVTILADMKGRGCGASFYYS